MADHIANHPCSNPDPAGTIAAGLVRHSRAIEQREWDLLASAYAPDAILSYGAFEGSIRDFAAMASQATADAPVSLHRTTNIAISLEGEQARSESYALVCRQAPDADPAQYHLIGGRYLDRHQRRDGSWRIVHRKFVMDWNARFAGEVVARVRDLYADDIGAFPAGEARFLHDLVVDYARAADRGDEALAASVFHADADVATGTMDGKGPDHARDVIAMVRGNLRSCFHGIARERFQISGDRATGETQIFAHVIPLGDAPQELLTAGRYIDRFERRGGDWRILHRSFASDWTLSQPLSMDVDGACDDQRLRGDWTPLDPSTSFWQG